MHTELWNELMWQAPFSVVATFLLCVVVVVVLVVVVVVAIVIVKLS